MLDLRKCYFNLCLDDFHNFNLIENKVLIWV